MKRRGPHLYISFSQGSSLAASCIGGVHGACGVFVTDEFNVQGPVTTLPPVSLQAWRADEPSGSSVYRTSATVDAPHSRRSAQLPTRRLYDNLQVQASMTALFDMGGKYGREAARRTGPTRQTYDPVVKGEVNPASRAGLDGKIVIGDPSSRPRREKAAAIIHSR